MNDHKTNPEILQHNRAAWDLAVRSRIRWTVPVSSEAVDNARKGSWSVYLTPMLPVPRDWFPALQGLKVLCLASGGGQQGPLLDAAGAIVTVFDNSLLPS